MLIADEKPADDLATPDVLDRICSGLTEDLDIAGVAVSLMSAEGSHGVAAASQGWIRDVDDLQFTVGEGPCHDAFRLRRPVLTPDLHHVPGNPWPGYAESALAAGVRAAFAFPLFVGAAGFGVMDVYSAHPGSLSDAQLSTALTFAQIATETLVDGGLIRSDGELGTSLETALSYRSEIYQAQGMLMVDLGLPAADAMARLRGHAFAHDRPLGELARDIINGATLS